METPNAVAKQQEKKRGGNSDCMSNNRFALLDQEPDIHDEDVDDDECWADIMDRENSLPDGWAIAVKSTEEDSRATILQVMIICSHLWTLSAILDHCCAHDRLVWISMRSAILLGPLLTYNKLLW